RTRSHVREPSLGIVDQVKPAERTQVGGQCVPGDGAILAADVLRQLTALGCLADGTPQGLQKSSQVAGVTAGTQLVDVYLDNVGEVVAQPSAGVGLLGVDQFWPASDHDPLEKFVERQVRTKPILSLAPEKVGERDLNSRLSRLERAHRGHLYDLE